MKQILPPPSFASKMTALLLALMFVVPAWAKQVNVEKAKSEARLFLDGEVRSRSGNTVDLKYLESPDAVVAPAYYVFNAADGKGFVMVSADNRINKILAYSRENSFSYDNMPPVVKEMLQRFDAYVGELPDDMPAHESWLRASAGEANEKVLPTAKWAQDVPFNNLCPPGGYPTGCVATAMAIVMKYHNWPDRGRGSSSYEWNGQTLSMDFDRKFDWENMVDDYFSVKYTDAQAAAVAELMLACGIAVEMNYNKMGSGANVTTHIMHNNFRYSPNAVNQSVASFSDADIIARVKGEIDASRPMICSGGYHSFVCDGYSGDMLHFNFGWGGWDDGFYDMKALAPLDNMPVDNIMMGLEPYKDDTVYPPLIIQVGNAHFDYVNEISKSSGLHVDVSRIESGVPFNAAVSSLKITLSYPEITAYVGEAGIGLFDKNGALKEVANNTKELYSWLDSYKLTFQNTVFEQSDIVAGDYVAVVGRNKGDSKWLQIPVDQGLNATVDAMDTGAVRIPVSWKLGDRINITDITKPAQSSDRSFAWRGMPFRVYFRGADDAVAASVKVNGVVVPVSSWTGIYDFQIDIPCHDSYRIEIQDYRADEMLENYPVALVHPGTLQSVLPVDPARIKSLVLSGNVDARDIYFIRDCMANLCSLDMSKATIAAYEDYKANIMPKNSFKGITVLKNIVLPDNIEGLEVQAFFNSGITSIRIPASLHYLQGSCLPGLESVYEYALTPPDVYDIWYMPQNTVLYVPVGTAELYKAHSSWNSFKDYVELPELGIAGIEAVDVASDEIVSVYDLHGIAVYEGAFGAMPSLPSGVYVVRSACGVAKLAVNR